MALHLVENGHPSYTVIDGHSEGVVEIPIYEDVWVITDIYTITYCTECGATQ